MNRPEQRAERPPPAGNGGYQFHPDKIVLWLQPKYRTIMHRHDGAYRAIDSALNVWWEAEDIGTLFELIEKHPATERAP